MANGEELKEYRQKVLTTLLNDKDTCELVLCRGVSDIDDADIQDELREGHIYRFPYIPKTDENANTYITFEISAKKSPVNDTYKRMTLFFYIFCHQDIMDDKESGYLRTDLLNERVQKLFNKNPNIGIGQLVCTSDEFLRVSKSYCGRMLKFVTTDLNSGVGV